MGVHTRPGTRGTAPTASEDGPPTACEDRDGPFPRPARTVDHRGVGAGALLCEYLETVDPLSCCRQNAVLVGFRWAVLQYYVGIALMEE